MEAKETGLIKRDGRLLVNAQGLCEGWNLYLTTRTDPDLQRIWEALRVLRKNKQTIQLRWKGRHIRYREIDIDHLLVWSDQYQLGETKTLLESVKGKNPLKFLEVVEN
jgi:hypothetical protein